MAGTVDVVRKYSPDDGIRRASIRRLGELDWDFPTQASESPFSALHWHPCRFPSQIPAISIARLTSPGASILDPFMGSATTSVESQRLGRVSVGIDTNPISALMGRAKTLQASGRDVSRYVHGLQLDVLKRWNDVPESEIPVSVQQEKWYTDKTLRSLHKIWSTIDADKQELGIIGKAAFSSILLAACRETRHWGYICDNSMPKSDRELDILGLYANALARFSQAYNLRDIEVSAVPEAQIFNGPSEDVLRSFNSATFDCVVTSPPYFGVADYVKAQRLSMEWLSHDIEPVRLKEIGARSKRHRRSSLDDYINDLQRVFSEVSRVMKDDAIAIIVFGQSPSRADSHGRFIEMLVSQGFCIELERRRQIPRTRRQMPSLLDEIVIVARKEPQT